VFSIKEFAQLCQVERSTLHHWDKTGLLSPARRNEKTGYRYYSPEQIMTASLIQMLNGLGMAPSRISELKEIGRPQQVFQLLCFCDKQIEEKIQQLRAWREIMQSYAALIDESHAAQPGKIELRWLAERPVQCIPTDKNLRDSVTQAHNGGSPMGYAYQNLYDLLEAPEHPAQLVFFDPQGPEIRPAGRYLIGTVKCALGEIGGLPRRMLDHALRHGMELHGPACAIYLHDTEHEEYLLQISVAVK